jgi:hypothetical protein
MNKPRSNRVRRERILSSLHGSAYSIIYLAERDTTGLTQEQQQSQQRKTGSSLPTPLTVTLSEAKGAMSGEAHRARPFSEPVPP